VGIRQTGQLVCFKCELFHLYVCLKDVRDFGIEQQPDKTFLERKLDIVVVGTKHNEVKVYLNRFYIFITIRDDDCECLLVEFLKRGRKVNL
jgi:hypothetical protein